jgi:hypothetical protein
VKTNIGRNARRITAQTGELDLRIVLDLGIVDLKSEKQGSLWGGAAVRFRRRRRMLKILIP